MRVGGVVMLVLSLPLVGLVDPRHGSEVVGYPLMLLGAGLRALIKA